MCSLFPEWIVNVFFVIGALATVGTGAFVFWFIKDHHETHREFQNFHKGNAGRL